MVLEWVTRRSTKRVTQIQKARIKILSLSYPDILLEGLNADLPFKSHLSISNCHDCG